MLRRRARSSRRRRLHRALADEGRGTAGRALAARRRSRRVPARRALPPRRHGSHGGCPYGGRRTEEHMTDERATGREAPPPRRETGRVPAQEQGRQRGREQEMVPAPRYEGEAYRAGGKLEGKVAAITGGDSGIGRAVAVHFAKEGADVAILYLEEDEDAEQVKRDVEAQGRRALLIKGDIGDPGFCEEAIEEVVAELGRLDVLANNAAEQ